MFLLSLHDSRSYLAFRWTGFSSWFLTGPALLIPFDGENLGQSFPQRSTSFGNTFPFFESPPDLFAAQERKNLENFYGQTRNFLYRLRDPRKAL